MPRKRAACFSTYLASISEQSHTLAAVSTSCDVDTTCFSPRYSGVPLISNRSPRPPVGRNGARLETFCLARLQACCVRATHPRRHSLESAHGSQPEERAGLGARAAPAGRHRLALTLPRHTPRRARRAHAGLCAQQKCEELGCDTVDRSRSSRHEWDHHRRCEEA